MSHAPPHPLQRRRGPVKIPLGAADFGLLVFHINLNIFYRFNDGIQVPEHDCFQHVLPQVVGRAHARAVAAERTAGIGDAPPSCGLDEGASAVAALQKPANRPTLLSNPMPRVFLLICT